MDVTDFVNERFEPVEFALEGKAKVWIKGLSPRKFEQISERNTKYRTRGGVVVPRTNNRAVTIQLLQETVVRWEHIESEGEALECNPQNQLLLFDFWPVFRRVWNDAVLGALGIDWEVQESLEGNSLDGPSGS